MRMLKPTGRRVCGAKGWSEMIWRYNDGGRATAGFKGEAGDCACRAIAIATGKPYWEAYHLIDEFGSLERSSKKRKGIKSSARTGAYRPTMRKIMASLGWAWTPTMKIGSGCKVHLRTGELPSGRLVVSLSRHYAAVLDGEVHDTYDPTRNGTRCVYGYWTEAAWSLAWNP